MYLTITYRYRTCFNNFNLLRCTSIGIFHDLPIIIILITPILWKKSIDDEVNQNNISITQKILTI